MLIISLICKNKAKRNKYILIVAMVQQSNAWKVLNQVKLGFKNIFNLHHTLNKTVYVFKTDTKPNVSFTIEYV